jgi:sodium-dependent dicarboxylate transporter 2/3/5
MGEMRATVAAESGWKIEPDTKRFLYVLIAIAVGAITYFIPITQVESGRRVLSITLFVLTMFVFEPVPLGITGLIGCWLYWVWAGMPPAKAFAGFSMDTPWFILGVLLLGLLAETSGLAKRVAYKIILKGSTKYVFILLTMMIIDFILTFIIASAVVKCLLMCTIAIRLIDSYGVQKGSNIGRGLVLVVTYQSGLWDKVILAGAGNILSRGIIESVGKVHVSYGLWLVAFLPITVLTLLACWIIIWKMFPPEKRVLEGGQAYCEAELKKMGPMSKDEIKALILVGLATLMWVTDYWHHISPSIIGVIVGLVACLPFVGGLKKEDISKANYMIVIFVAAAMSLGRVMADTEILKALTVELFKWMTPVLHTASITASMFVYWYANLFHLFLANETAMIGATMPALMEFAVREHFNPVTLGMLWAFSAGGKVFVYQSAVMAVGYAFGYFSMKDFFKFGLAIFFVESFFLLIIIPWYWPLLGLTFR